MEKFVKNSLVLGMLSCPGVFFLNPPFWILLLMTEPPLDPSVKRIAGHVGDWLEWCSRDRAIGMNSEFGGHAMIPANCNEPTTKEPARIAA